MGLFDFFKRKPIAVNGTVIQPENGAQPATAKLHEAGVQGIASIYKFLQADYETRGYNDAFVSPDESYKNDNIRLLIRDFEILLQQVTTYYEDMQKDLDFHIATRSRAGLVDLIEELQTRKLKVAEHIEKVSVMRKELTDQSGMSQRIILSYQRGFMRGLSAITQSNVLNKPL